MAIRGAADAGLITVGVIVDGEAQYMRGFQQLHREVEDLRDPLTLVGHALIQAVGEQFLTEGHAGGTPWPQLTQDYRIWKDQHFPGHPMLVASGEMRAEMLDPLALTVAPRGLRYEPDSDIAIYHQRGTVKMKQRKLVALSSGVRRSFDRIFAEWINGLIRGPIWTGRTAA